MTRVQRLLAASIVIAVASIGLAAVRLATSGSGASTTPQTPTVLSGPSATPVDTAAAPRAPVARAVRAAQVNLKQGVPSPGPVRIDARVGDEVRLTVTSSGAEDDVIVDGYGLRVHVTPSSPARVRFVAARPGYFDAVLDTTGAKLADIDITR
jgi:nitrous oxide reductase